MFIANLERYKLPSNDQISAELNQAGGETLLAEILKLINSVLNKEELPGQCDRLCGLVVRVLGYRSGGPGSISGTTKKKVMGLERGPHSLVSTTELLDRRVAAPV
jgi:hypothetical protein